MLVRVLLNHHLRESTPTLMGGGKADPTNVGWTFKDYRPMPELTPEQKHRLERRFEMVIWRDVVLPIRSLIATQPSVKADYWNALSIERGLLPVVVRVNNEFYVRDGHHRIVNAAENGYTKVRVALVDADNAETETETPLLDYKPMSKKDKEEIQRILDELDAWDADPTS